jgi:hypothetical protein
MLSQGLMLYFLYITKNKAVSVTKESTQTRMNATNSGVFEY